MPSALTLNMRSALSREGLCLMPAMVKSLCSGVFCSACRAWVWALAAPTAPVVPNPLKVLAWWVMCWASITRTATALHTTRWCAWRRTFHSVTHWLTAKATLVAVTATALPPCATQKRVWPASPACCSMSWTKARWTLFLTMTALLKSRANCLPACRSRCLTVPAGSQ